MDYIVMLRDIFEVCVIPLLGVLTTYLVKLIQKKSDEILATTDSALADKYITMLTDTVIACVNATNQTYVDALKGKDAFDADAQKKAFEITYKSVMKILTEDAQKYLASTYGDLETYIKKMIESEVRNNKLPVTE